MTHQFSSRLKPYVLRHEDRHNVCPYCGRDPLIAFREDDICEVFCSTCIDLDIRFILGEDHTNNTIRRNYNMIALSERYTSEALQNIGINNGEYALVDYEDGFLCYFGDETSVAKHCAAAIEKKPHAYYRIYRLHDYQFHFICSSDMIREAISGDNDTH